MLFLGLLLAVLPLRGAYLLIPMDNTQTNHLKAYGVAYFVLQREVEISWLLNYRGGSYLIPYHEMFEGMQDAQCVVSGDCRCAGRRHLG